MTSFKTRLKSISWQRLLFPLLGVLILDQISKLFVLSAFQQGEILEVIPGFFNLTLHFNKGAAFGIFSELDDGIRQLVLGGFSKIAILMLLVFLVYEFHESKLGQFSIGLILGGAVGNIIDRVYRGEVVDFLDFYISAYHWPAFNVADSAICIGVFTLIFFESASRSKTEAKLSEK